ncbi:hypothetical protein PCANB_001977 [Pneumocystis canis]|nr:hypothetical protein PCANB_001977 [Pneumocystis canis]
MQRLDFDEILPLEKLLGLKLQLSNTKFEELDKVNISNVSINQLSITNETNKLPLIQTLPVDKPVKPIIERPLETPLFQRLRTFLSTQIKSKINIKSYRMQKIRTIDTYITQSSLLLTAAPKTTRLCIRYRVKHVDTAIKGYLIFRTYDPVSGICLRFQTDQAADVTRLMTGAFKFSHIMMNTMKSLETEQIMHIESNEHFIHSANTEHIEQTNKSISVQKKRHKKRR